MRFIYAVFDKKAKAYGALVSATHDAVATRDFGAACQDGSTSLSRFPEDFELHRLGQLQDQLVGDREIPVVGCEPVVVVTAAAVKAMGQPSRPELVKEA